MVCVFCGYDKNVLCAGCQLHLTQWLQCVRWQPPQIKWLTSLHAKSWWRRPRSEGPAWSSCLRALTTSDPVERRHCRSLRAWQETQYHNTHSWPGRQSVILFCFFARSKVKIRQLLLRDDFLYSNILRIHLSLEFWLRRHVDMDSGHVYDPCRCFNLLWFQDVRSMAVTWRISWARTWLGVWQTDLQQSCHH